MIKMSFKVFIEEKLKQITERFLELFYENLHASQRINFNEKYEFNYSIPDRIMVGDELGVNAMNILENFIEELLKEYNVLKTDLFPIYNLNEPDLVRNETTLSFGIRFRRSDDELFLLLFPDKSYQEYTDIIEEKYPNLVFEDISGDYIGSDKNFLDFNYQKVVN